ncbi:unnamed protein product [Eruca vesicaria subsp. sativa]|uniref:Uncharacterized protein n=1 Tax=Eruca vesicaria subsp. sativa TaxID=29727 RepID=A0ABC8JA64_ERUVS|nr:unnamed protein product [Eruca vesicaria subsp. sativa]
MESPAESQSAEFWFHSAPSYAPSPFVTKLLLSEEEEEVSDDKTEAVSTKLEARDIFEKDREMYQPPYLNKTGPTVSIHNHIDKPIFRAKSSIRPTPRSSTLMKPTASQLYWLSVGAQPTDSVENMLFRAGLIPPKPMVVVGSKNGQQSTNHHVSPITGEILN